jgi:hypothetical protein
LHQLKLDKNRSNQEKLKIFVSQLEATKSGNGGDLDGPGISKHEIYQDNLRPCKMQLNTLEGRSVYLETLPYYEEGLVWSKNDSKNQVDNFVCYVQTPLPRVGVSQSVSF